MGRQNNDDSTTMVNSSIALLQERFRELQRVREKRQEKELLKLFSESDRASPSMHFEQPAAAKLTFQPDMMILPNRQTSEPLQDSLLSLGLNSQSRQQADFRDKKASSSLWPKTGSSSSRNFENSDVDTSLHL